MNIEGAWALIGNFNCILRLEELSSVIGASSFAEWVDRRGLINLGFLAQGLLGIIEQIFRRGDQQGWIGVCAKRSGKNFPVSNNSTLTHLHSDHCPLLLRLEPDEGIRLGCRPFKFRSAWIVHRDFFSWAEREWKWEGNLVDSLKHFSKKLMAWNRDTFGIIFQRKQRCLL